MTEPKTTAQPHPLWRLAFRPGFLLAAAFAVLAMGRWLWWLLAPAHWDFRLQPNWWHAHEMVFGFALPVVAGFLLTAVATWTGLPGTRGGRLQLLFGLWLTARALLWCLPGIPLAAWLAEMLFIGLLTVELTRRVWAVRQWRNLLFTPVLLVLAALCSGSYWTANTPDVSRQLHYGAVWMLVVLVVIVGGRVIPLFTANRLGLRIAPLPVWFESLAIGITAAIGVIVALVPRWHSALTLLCLAGGLVHLARLAHWRSWLTLRVPLLWSMHASYLCIPLAMLGLAWLGGDVVAGRHLIHLPAVGAIGGMILAMMSRVSLGHTGRPLEVPRYIACAFALVLLAAVVRALLPLAFPPLTHWAFRASALLWLAAFALFLWHYLPVLTRARVDGKPG